MNVKLISYTQPSDELAEEWNKDPDFLDLVSYCARVSNPSNQMNDQTSEKLVGFLAKHGHWSPFEMVSACLEINTTRDIAHQIVRHRSFSFQEFCVSGDTEVTTLTASGRSKKVRIEDLYKRWMTPQYWDGSDNLVRVYDEKTNSFTSAKIKEVFETGVKPVYRMTLDNGKTVTATKDHKFFLHGSGFCTLGDLGVGDFVGVNGTPVYQSPLDLSKCEVDHIEPVYKRPDLAFDPNNLRVVHKDKHREKSLLESVESRYTMKFDRVASIEYVGEVMTYDLEVDHDSHNYVANGIVSHNSQRYADPTKDLDFVLREARLQDSKNRQNSIELDDTPVNRTLEEMWVQKQKKVKDAAIDAYKWGIEQGIAKEQVRAVLPEGMTESRLYMNGTLRSWIHYIQLRSGNGTQKEHAQIARECGCVIASIFPLIADYTDA